MKQKRESELHKKGDDKWQSANVNADICLEPTMDVVMAIADEWPHAQWNNPDFKIRIQQEGAEAHTSGRFFENFQCTLEGLVCDGALPFREKIFLDTQPAQSPDLNVDDLGLFAALWAQCERTVAKDALQLVSNAKKARDECPAQKINCLFLALQACVNEIIDNQGGNDHKIPHVSKEKLEREGKLPAVLEVSPLAAGLIGTRGDFDSDPIAEPGPPDVAEVDQMPAERAAWSPTLERATRSSAQGLLED